MKEFSEQSPKRQYFKGVTFRRYESPPSILVVRDGVATPYESTREVPEVPIYSAPEPLKDAEPRKQLWTVDEVKTEFAEYLGAIEEKIGQPLPMNHIDLQFVTREAMRPQNEEERAALVEKYGEYILDGSAGDCTQHADDTFSIRIGYAGMEDTIDKDTILEVMGHEYGHTIGGSFIDDAEAEEIKADAMGNLVMKHYYDVDYYSGFAFDDSTVHKSATYKLDLLTSRGITEEMVIAHLTDEPFGPYNPDSYKDLI